MAKIAPIPESQQGGGASVSEAEVAEFATILRSDPSANVQAEDQDGFKVKPGEAAKKARGRAVSAAGRMREKVAQLLQIEIESVETHTRATEHNGQGKPTRYGYWLTLTAPGIEALGGDSASEATAEEAAA
jgi:hypothetical protein